MIYSQLHRAEPIPARRLHGGRFEFQNFLSVETASVKETVSRSREFSITGGVPTTVVSAFLGVAIIRDFQGRQGGGN